MGSRRCNSSMYDWNVNPSSTCERVYLNIKCKFLPTPTRSCVCASVYTCVKQHVHGSVCVSTSGCTWWYECMPTTFQKKRRTQGCLRACIRKKTWVRARQHSVICIRKKTWVRARQHSVICIRKKTWVRARQHSVICIRKKTWVRARQHSVILSPPCSLSSCTLHMTRDMSHHQSLCASRHARFDTTCAFWCLHACERNRMLMHV
jgi:hypothetical protein